MKRWLSKFIGLLKKRPPSKRLFAERELDRFQRRLGYFFKEPSLLELALIHSSSRETNAEAACNERLEFLGDSVLGLVIVEYLFHRYQEEPEGELTRIKSIVVSKQPLQEIGEALQLQNMLQLGRGLHRDRLPNSVLANATEALIGAIYLDGGLDPARKFVISRLVPEIDKIEKHLHPQNYKSLLQTECQREFGISPAYRVMSTRGPEHKKEFQVAVMVRERLLSKAWGINKKVAEQTAALDALKELGIDTGDVDA